MATIGHQKQREFLKRIAEKGKIPHAFLFYGQEQLGKKTLAIEFVKYLNCKETVRPCQVCRSCQDIQKGLYPDFNLIKPETSQTIQISQIRDLIWKLSLRSYSAPFKVAVIDKAHLMTQAAQNSFLKILEEPKGKTLLILITEYSEMLLPTILSRVQKLRFSAVKNKEIESYLINQGASKSNAEYLSLLSLGRPGMALNFLLDSQKLKNQEKLISDLIKISNSDLAFRFEYAKTLSKMTSDALTIDRILETWLRYLRNIFLSRLTKESSRRRTSISLKRDDVFNHYSLSKLKNILRLIQSTNFLISTTNVNSKLALEVLLMEV